MTKGKALAGKLCAENPHLWIVEMEVASMATPRCSGIPVAKMSMGLATLEPGNSFSLSSSAAFPDNAGTFIPPFDSASVSITPGPPAWVTMAKFLPVKRGRVKIQPTVVNSSREKHLTIPALRNNASTAESLEAIAPV